MIEDRPGDATAVNGVVTVVPITAGPEPASLSMTAVALAMGGGYGLRPRRRAA